MGEQAIFRGLHCGDTCAPAILARTCDACPCVSAQCCDAGWVCLCTGQWAMSRVWRDSPARVPCTHRRGCGARFALCCCVSGRAVRPPPPPPLFHDPPRVPPQVARSAGQHELYHVWLALALFMLGRPSAKPPVTVTGGAGALEGPGAQPAPVGDQAGKAARAGARCAPCVPCVLFSLDAPPVCHGVARGARRGVVGFVVGFVVWFVVWCGVVGFVVWWGLWCGVVWCGAVQCGAVWCGVVRCGAVRCGVVWCGVVWCDMWHVPHHPPSARRPLAPPFPRRPSPAVCCVVFASPPPPPPPPVPGAGPGAVPGAGAGTGAGAPTGFPLLEPELAGGGLAGLGGVSSAASALPAVGRPQVGSSSLLLLAGLGAANPAPVSSAAALGSRLWPLAGATVVPGAQRCVVSGVCY